MNNSEIVRLLSAITCCFSSFHAVNADGGPDGHGPLPIPAVEKPAEPTLTERYGVWFVPPPEMILPEMETQKYINEDGPLDQGSPVRFSIERSVDLTLADGQWLDVAGGRLWRVDITMTGAVNSRLHLSGLSLADGQELALVSPDFDPTMSGVLSGTGDFGNGEAFGICGPSPRTRIEWFVPTGQSAKQLPFTEIMDAYGYRDVFQLSQYGGTCSLNPACYAAWLNESNATCKMTFTEGGFGYECSAQLIATTAADETPYIATANHCISTQAVANTAQFIFFFRSACTGGNSAGTTVSGADLTLTHLASDSTLLMIRGTLPASVYWVGWSNANPAVSTASTCLHHPSGTAQAISFGSKNAGSFNCGAPAGNWNSVSWTSGITEGGSSGSAIYQDSTHKLYGVLTCGASACSNPAADDGYGRWDLAVNSGGFAAKLAVGADDTLEQNDTCATAWPLAAGTYSGLVVKRLDEDWYAITVGSGSTLSGTFTYTHANGDIDLELYSSCGGTPVLIRNGNVNNETLSYVNPGATAVFYLRVFLATDTRNEYSMVISVPITGPANDNCATPTAIGNSGIAFNTATATNSTPSLPTSCDEGFGIVMNNDLWYAYTAVCTGTATASTCGAATFDTRIAVYSSCASAVIACSDNASGCTGNTSKASWPVTAGSVSYVRIGSATSATGTGTLTLSCTLACVADRNGDRFVDGADLAVLIASWATSDADLNGDFYTDGADLSIMLGSFGSCP